MHSLHITANGFSARWHRTINPGTNFDRTATRDITAEIRRDLNCQTDFTFAHTPIKIVIIGYGCFFGEIPRTSKLLRIIPADRCVVAIQNSECKILNIQIDTVSDNEHQDHSA